MIIRRASLYRPVFYALALTFPIMAFSSSARADSPVDYQRQIKPLLSDRCYVCHGPDEKQRKADLRLDLRSVAIDTEAIVPGKSSASAILERLTSDDPEIKMPPPKSNKTPLTSKEVALIRRWIDEGAEFTEHWAYRKIARPAVPKTPGGWAQNPVDRFILRRLIERGLKPSPAADRRTLIRRLSFDLTGLPPTRAEVDAFVNDKSARAFEKIVDRLLASKHYGERMAVYWLDVVRFADTIGYHSDNTRALAPYRDYVIAAFNENKPYDAFVREQLAGDLIPNATNEQKIASGFNRLNMTTQEGGAQPKEYVAIYLADRVRNNNVIFLGLTMGCCQCHDHKYDPLTMRDFYSFGAFFADIKETLVGRQTPVTLLDKRQMQRDFELNVMVEKAQKELARPSAKFDAAQLEWEKSLGSFENVWTVLKPSAAKSQGGATLAIQSDGSILAQGKNPATDTYTITLKTSLTGITALRLEASPDNKLRAKGPGRAVNGNFVLNRIELKVNGKPLAWNNATASFSQKGFHIRGAIDADGKSGWAVMPAFGRRHAAIFSTRAPISVGKELTLTVTMQQNYGSRHTIGHFRFSVTNVADPHVRGAKGGLPGNVATILAIERSKRKAGQKMVLRRYFRTTATVTAGLRKTMDDAKKEKETLRKQARKTLVSMAMKPRVVRILKRGDWQDESGQIVQPAVPAYLGTLKLKKGARGTRMDLANWIVSKDNPLTSPVMVNRLWKLMFGRGLVNSPGDFGAQGERPTHPRLLDWLALEFVESGWDVKHMMKLMAMSAAYGQSSHATPEALARDPQNRELARQGRFRLDAEFIRDNALKISGLLVTKIGGPSVKPYQPAGYWAHLNFPRRTWKHDTGENQYRRGLYTFWQRTFLHPSLASFDAPSREECTVQRATSNTPLQALALLNDPTYVEAGREFARRIIVEGGKGDSDRLRFAFLTALGRDIGTNEAKILTHLLDKHRRQFRENAAEAAKILKIGLKPAPKEINAVELAAWTSVARTILNLHETITRN